MADPNESVRRDSGQASPASRAEPSPTAAAPNADAAGVGGLAAHEETKPETSPAAAEDDAAPDVNVDAATPSPDPSSQPTTSALQKTKALAWKGVRSVSFWTVFGIITTFLFTLPSAWPTWCAWFGGCKDPVDPTPLGRLDPALAMVCLEFAEHPVRADQLPPRYLR